MKEEVSMPHLKFIMADCCNFMCLENLYELRDVCDYIIGSPAEIPAQGAPYYDIVPSLTSRVRPLLAMRSSAAENLYRPPSITERVVPWLCYVPTCRWRICAIMS